MRRHYVFQHALLPDGWQSKVRITVADGVISGITPEGSCEGAEVVRGFAVPGVPNLHSHAFQRGMAGLAERRSPANDSFWTWRDVMYRFLGQLTPDDVEAIAAFAYVEMLERGFTTVGEFHYLHHAADGTPYADLGEMSFRIAAAAAQTGIGITLLPVLYGYADFGGAPPMETQRRFLNHPDRFLRLVERARAAVATLSAASVGIAPHSLRAVTPETLRTVLDSAGSGPIHIHIAEQTREVEDCIAWSGQRPIEWLVDHVPVDERWCLVHATHLTAAETRRVAFSRAVVGLCPITEASLGDGVFNGPEYLNMGGRFGVGSDSNIDIDAAGELRQLEYSQRIARRSRNVLTTREGESTGERLFLEALKGGAQAVGRPIGKLEVGYHADIVVLDSEHPDLANNRSDYRLDTWIFSAGHSAVRMTLALGEKVVMDGRHVRRDDIVARYHATMRKLREV